MCLIIERACRSSRNKLIAITSPTDLQRNRREHYLQVVTIYKRALTGINVVTTDLKKKKTLDTRPRVFTEADFYASISDFCTARRYQREVLQPG